MSDAFICKDQHYEIISSVENEKSFTTTQIAVTMPAKLGNSNKLTETFSFPIGGIPLWFIFESMYPASGETLYDSSTDTGVKYASLDNPYNLGHSEMFTTRSGSRYLTYTYFYFTANTSTLNFDIKVETQVFLNQGSALTYNLTLNSDTLTLLIKYKLQS